MNADDANLDSPFHSLLGFHLEEWRDGLARVSVEIERRHLNRNGILHGGVLLAMMDEVGGLCGVWSDDPARVRRSVTVNLSSSFTGRVQAGRIEATGQLINHGRALYFSRSEVHGPGGALLAFAASTHRWRTGSGPA